MPRQRHSCTSLLSGKQTAAVLLCSVYSVIATVIILKVGRGKLARKCDNLTGVVS